MTLDLSPQTYRLTLTVDLSNGQTLTSFLSALAARNGLQSPARFCVAFGLDLADLDKGEDEALSNLAKLTGVPVERLARSSSRRRPMPTLMGQHIDAADMGAYLRVCPQCLAEDRAQQPHWPFAAAGKFRAAWSHNLVQACIDHELQLVALPASLGNFPINDFAIALRALEASGEILSTVRRVVSPLEAFIHGRLAGAGAGIAVLDPLTLADATFFCTYLGAHHRPAHRAVAPINIDHALDQANHGFAIALDGASAVRARLDEIAETVNPLGVAEIGLRRVFMTLYDRVKGRSESDMLAIRQMMVDIGTARCLIDFEQTEALGLPVPPRDRQTLESAQRRFGINGRNIRAALIELRAIPHDDQPKAANTVLFEASPVSAVLARIKESLNLVEAARLLGLHPQQLVKICDAGLLKPFFMRPSHDLKPLRYFERVDVEGFLARLTANCKRVAETASMVDIWEAGLKTCRQPVEIIAAIHDGRIVKTYSATRQPSVRDIRLALDDVRSVTFDAADNLMSAEDCSRILTINLHAMRSIMQSGILKSEVGINSVNHRRQLSARMTVVKEFDKEFVSLNSLRERFKTSGPGMAQALFKAGASPAFPINQSVISIYRRDEVARVQARLQRIIEQRQAMSRWSGQRR